MADEIRNDGGPAFPRPYSASASGWYEEYVQGGMSLREYFAGQALASRLRDWWAWLGELTVTIRWPRREREDWLGEGNQR